MLFLLLSALSAATDVPPLLPTEAAVLAAREAIRDAHLVVEIDTKDSRHGSVRTRYRYETWFELNRQRTEVTPLDDATRAAPGQLPFDQVLCLNCPEPNTVLGYGRNGTLVEISKPGEPNGAGGNDPGRRLLVRRLGLSFADARTLDQHPPEQTVGVSRLPEFTQTDEVVNGRRLVKLRGRLRAGAYKTVWIDPDRGPAVVRVEAAGTNAVPKRPDMRSVMEVEPARDEVSGVWYFRACKRAVDFGKGVGGEETITVRTMELNRGIDPAVFTMAALKIPAGTPVRSGGNREYNTVWDGTKLVGRVGYEKTPAYTAALDAMGGLPAVSDNPEPVAPVPAAGPPRWQLGAAAALAVAGALALVRFARRF